jgi:hypothetical protein
MLFFCRNFDFVVLWLGDHCWDMLLNFDLVGALDWDFHGIRNLLFNLDWDFFNDWVGLWNWDLFI